MLIDKRLTDAQSKAVKTVRRLMDRFEIDVHAEDWDIAWAIGKVLDDVRKDSEVRAKLRREFEDLYRSTDRVV